MNSNILAVIDINQKEHATENSKSANKLIKPQKSAVLLIEMESEQDGSGLGTHHQLLSNSISINYPIWVFLPHFLKKSTMWNIVNKLKNQQYHVKVYLLHKKLHLAINGAKLRTIRPIEIGPEFKYHSV